MGGGIDLVGNGCEWTWWLRVANVSYLYSCIKNCNATALGKCPSPVTLLAEKFRSVWYYGTYEIRGGWLSIRLVAVVNYALPQERNKGLWVLRRLSGKLGGVVPHL